MSVSSVQNSVVVVSVCGCVRRGQIGCGCGAYDYGLDGSSVSGNL